jgi:hypothetical protein
LTCSLHLTKLLLPPIRQVFITFVADEWRQVRGKCGTDAILLDGQQDLAVDTVENPLRLNVIARHVIALLTGAIHDLMSDEICINVLLIPDHTSAERTNDELEGASGAL